MSKARDTLLQPSRKGYIESDSGIWFAVTGVFYTQYFTHMDDL